MDKIGKKIGKIKTLDDSYNTFLREFQINKDYISSYNIINNNISKIKNNSDEYKLLQKIFEFNKKNNNVVVNTILEKTNFVLDKRIINIFDPEFNYSVHDISKKINKEYESLIDGNSLSFMENIDNDKKKLNFIDNMGIDENKALLLFHNDSKYISLLSKIGIKEEKNLELFCEKFSKLNIQNYLYFNYSKKIFEENSILFNLNVSELVNKRDDTFYKVFKQNPFLLTFYDYKELDKIEYSSLPTDFILNILSNNNKFLFGDKNLKYVESQVDLNKMLTLITTQDFKDKFYPIQSYILNTINNGNGKQILLSFIRLIQIKSEIEGSEYITELENGDSFLYKTGTSIGKYDNISKFLNENIITIMKELIELENNTQKENEFLLKSYSESEIDIFNKKNKENTQKMMNLVLFELNDTLDTELLKNQDFIHYFKRIFDLDSENINENVLYFFNKNKNRLELTPLFLEKFIMYIKDNIDDQYYFLDGLDFNNKKDLGDFLLFGDKLYISKLRINEMYSYNALNPRDFTDLGKFRVINNINKWYVHNENGERIFEDYINYHPSSAGAKHRFKSLGDYLIIGYKKENHNSGILDEIRDKNGNILLSKKDIENSGNDFFTIGNDIWLGNKKLKENNILELINEVKNGEKFS